MACVNINSAMLSQPLPLRSCLSPDYFNWYRSIMDLPQSLLPDWDSGGRVTLSQVKLFESSNGGRKVGFEIQPVRKTHGKGKSLRQRTTIPRRRRIALGGARLAGTAGRDKVWKTEGKESRAPRLSFGSLGLQIVKKVVMRQDQ